MTTPPPENPRGLCPVCERFVGPVETCPYCDEQTGGGVRLLRRGALLLAVLGLALLFVMVRNRDVPVVQAGSITPAMNFGYVRIIGTAAADARIYRTRGEVDYLSFPLDDGTGTITASARKSCAKDIIAGARPPRKGDRVEVAGSLRVQAGGEARLYIEVPAHVRILDSSAERADKDADAR